MSNGEIKEFDTPLNLMDKEDGIFSNLIKENGQEFANKMRHLAINKEKNQFDEE